MSSDADMIDREIFSADEAARDGEGSSRWKKSDLTVVTDKKDGLECDYSKLSRAMDEAWRSEDKFEAQREEMRDRVGTLTTYKGARPLLAAKTCGGCGGHGYVMVLLAEYNGECPERTRSVTDVAQPPELSAAKGHPEPKRPRLESNSSNESGARARGDGGGGARRRIVARAAPLFGVAAHRKSLCRRHNNQHDFRVTCCCRRLGEKWVEVGGQELAEICDVTARAMRNRRARWASRGSECSAGESAATRYSEIQKDSESEPLPASPEPKRTRLSTIVIPNSE